MYSIDRPTHPTAARIQKIERSRRVAPSHLPKERSQARMRPKAVSPLLLLCVCLGLPYLSGCEIFSKTEADAQSKPPGSQRGGGKTAVNVATAKTAVLQETLEYPGTTSPQREVSLRAQVEGRLLNLQVDVGDPVKQGQILARLDDSLLVTGVTQAQAELAALESEVARARTQVQNARALAERAKAELQQAQVDAARLRSLAASGAIAQQEAELAQTEAATAREQLNSATTQIATEQQAVAAAEKRVEAQRAVIAEAKERQSYALLPSPINGVVLEKVNEPGNLIQPGGEVLRLGDFSSVKVVVPLSELELSNIRVGQSVRVRLDAFPNTPFSGTVTRISPAADTAARQLPIEITIPNSNGRIGSGLLARVSFESQTQPRVVVPETALQEDGERARGRDRESGSNPKSKIQNPKSSEATVFVVAGEGSEAKVQARSVRVGDRANESVEILSGLRPGERFVARSAKPLKDGETVRVSVLSRTPDKQEQQ